MAASSQRRAPGAPVRAERDREGIAALSSLLAGAREGTEFELSSSDGTSRHVPRTILNVLATMAEALARGDAVTVVVTGAEMTTQQAANLLNVSRQYVVRLLDEGRLPYTRTGTHRRIRVQDVLSFKDRRDAERESKLQELTALTEELDGYRTR